MSPLNWEILAALAFLGTHFALSHPLRASIVSRVGEAVFLAVYSLVAGVTLVWLALAFRAVPAEAPWWPAGDDGAWGIAMLLMLVASILLVGSLFGNPALPNPGRPTAPPEPRGVFTITRHPMMWAFALWSVSHILVMPTPSNAVLAGSVGFLALVGAALQDKKKERLQPGPWRAWEARTSYWPFAAILARRVRFGLPGAVPLLGGVVLWLAATWAHEPLAGVPAGIWRYIGH